MQTTQYDKLVFLRTRIKEIKVALFKSEMRSELQLPNSIIETLMVEEDGTIWFFTTCYGCQAPYLDRSFYACLNYYKKGSGFHLQVSGNAFIVETEKRNPFINAGVTPKNTGNNVLIKMKILQAEIFETRPAEPVTWPEKLKGIMYNFFIPPTHKSYNFSLPQIDRI